MRYTVLVSVALGFLAACSSGDDGAAEDRGSRGSGLSNIFSRGGAEPTAGQQAKPTDPRDLVPFIQSARSDRTTNGYVIRVQGLVDRAGYYDLELVARNNGRPDEAGTITYDFRASAPAYELDTPTDRSKQVQAAVFIPTITYNSARRVVVVSSQNSVTIAK